MTRGQKTREKIVPVWWESHAPQRSAAKVLGMGCKQGGGKRGRASREGCKQGGGAKGRGSKREGVQKGGGASTEGVQMGRCPCHHPLPPVAQNKLTKGAELAPAQQGQPPHSPRQSSRIPLHPSGSGISPRKQGVTFIREGDPQPLRRPGQLPQLKTSAVASGQISVPRPRADCI